MKPPRLLIIAFCGAIAVYLLAAFAYRNGYEAGEARERATARIQVNWHGSKAQTKDAVERWLRKEGPRGMKGRYIFVMYFPSKNCIQLKLDPGSVGGEPIYCYHANTLDLMEEASDSE